MGGGGLAMAVKRIAAVFPGQGSQSVGMGTDVVAGSASARELFSRAERVLGYDLFALVRDGPEERLRETQYSQPAIFTTNLALFAAFGDTRGDDAEVIVSAGHSFAEFCSLVIADAIAFEEALHVVDERARAMHEAAERAAGGMSAILGLNADRVREAVESLVNESNSVLQLANFNSPTQIVLSGDPSALRAAGELLLEAGAKRVVPLNVSGAWHSELMRPAIPRFAAAVEAVQFTMPRFDVISNVDGRPYRSVAQIKAALVQSVTGEVRWHETAEALLRYEPELVVEFGANPVLTALMRRMPDAPPTLAVSDAEAFV